MARGFRRVRSFGRRGMTPPSQFAARMDQKGRTLQWENLFGSFQAQELDTLTFLETYDSATGSQQWVRQLVGENLTRGQVTMLRVRGNTCIWASRLGFAGPTAGPLLPSPVLDGAGELGAFLQIWESIQLVPVVDGGIDTTVNTNSFMQVANTANQESTRIVWQRFRCAKLGAVDLGAASAGTAQTVLAYQSCQADTDVDVKVARRWNRSGWGLFYAIEAVPQMTTPELNLFFSGNLRGLFKATDSL